jgi:hypothetical protein
MLTSYTDVSANITNHDLIISRQNILRQQQIDKYYRTGRPIFGTYKSDIHVAIYPAHFWYIYHYKKIQF